MIFPTETSFKNLFQHQQIDFILDNIDNITREEFELLLDWYYEERSWNDHMEKL